MKCYLAKFTIPGGAFSFSAIWAETLGAANVIAKSRGMGPCKLASGPRKEFRPTILSKLKGGWRRADILHSLCYLSFLAARHGIYTAEELVEDGSPLHEFAHMLSAGPNIRGGSMQKILEASCAKLERAIPGMPPPGKVLELPGRDWETDGVHANSL